MGVGKINNGRSRIEAGEGRATSNVEDRETTDRKIQEPELLRVL